MITVESVKRYLNLDSDYKDDDKLIVQLINQCTNAVDAYTNGGNGEDFNDKDSSTEMPSRTEAMVYMLIAELYNTREMQSSNAYHKSPVFDLLAIPSTKFDSF